MAGFGTAPTSPLPVVGVDIGPTAASMVNTAILELQAIVTPKIIPAQIDLGSDVELKHGIRVEHIAAAAGVGVGAAFNGALLQYWQGAAAGDTVTFSLPVSINSRLRSAFLYGRANGVTAWSFKTYSVNMFTGVVTQIGSTQTSGIAAVIQALNAGSVTQTIGADTVIVVEWTAGAAGNRVYGIEYTLDKIATP